MTTHDTRSINWAGICKAVSWICLFLVALFTFLILGALAGGL